MALAARLDAVADLNQAQRAAMLGLLQRHFAGVDSATFAADLAAKSHVLRLLDDDRLLGMSCLDYRRHDFGECHEGRGGLLYSGDTVVDPAAWAAVELGPVWAAAVLALHQQSGRGPLWWLLLTSGLRTYRYLSVCVARYAPAPAERLDAQAQALLPQLAAARFAAAFDPASGLVRLAQPQTLRAHLELAPAHQCRDPASTFFLARNPGAAAGDELVSCCRFSEDNLTRAGQLALRRGRALWAREALPA